MMELASICEKGAQAAEGAQKKASVAQQKYTEEKKRSQALLEETERLAEALESKTKELATRPQLPSPQEEVKDADADAASDEVIKEEVQRLKSELQTRTSELQGSRNEAVEIRKQTKELSAKVQRLEGQLSRAHVAEQEAIRSSASAKGVHNAALRAVSEGQAAAGGVAGIIAGVLQDVELGDKAGITLTDLGLGDIVVLSPVDRFLQLLSALMTVRADARLAVSGLWILCHLIYVIYLVYAHFV